MKLDVLSNDNNFLVVDGYQQNVSSNVSQNLTPSTAQYLGQLAPNLNSGDDTNRLGFQVDATIDQPSNVDVYSFTAQPGTQVFITIDRTSMALGSVLELVDANGTVLAQAYAVLNVATNTYAMQYVGLAQPIQSGGVSLPDLYSINPRDASMSVILPGTINGQESTYYVRVRSDSSNLSNLTGGLTTGDYNLQIKLDDTYQWPGSEVEYADISYATNGVQVLGQPSASPLIGDSVSTGTNHSFDTAQDLGNLLDQSQNQISVAGSLTSVDWYKFELTYDLVQAISGNNAAYAWPSVFKVSYADGLAGPDTTLALYDSSGDLLYIGRNSDVADNEPPGQIAADTSNDTSGSFGADPFIGTVALTTSQTYYLAVMPGNELPATLDQQFVSASTNPLTRVEPIDSVARVSQNSFGSGDQGSTAAAPPSLTLTSTPYNLGNMVLYVNTNNPTNTTDTLYTVDPLTGQQETKVGTYIGSTGENGLTAPNQPTVSIGATIVMRNDGELYTDTTGTVDSAVNYTQISTSPVTATNLATTIGNDGLVTYDIPTGSTSAAIQNVGLSVNALAYIQNPANTQRTLYGVVTRPGGQGVTLTNNLLYSFDPNSGTVYQDLANTPIIPLTPTQTLPIGQVLTGSTITFPTNATVLPIASGTPPAIDPETDIEEGQTISINGKVFEFDSGPDENLDPNGGDNTQDGATFTLGGKTFEFHNGLSLTVNGGAGAGGVIQNGDSIYLTNSAGVKTQFQFINLGLGGQPTGNQIGYHTTDSASTIATDIAQAINLSGTTMKAEVVPGDPSEIALNTGIVTAAAVSTVTAAQSTDTNAVTVNGTATATTGDLVVPFQPYYTADQMGAAIQTAVNTSVLGSNVLASYATGEDRITFGTVSGAMTIASLNNSNFPTFPTAAVPFLSANVDVYTDEIVGSATVANPGNGYTSAPTVTFTNPASGALPTATATLGVNSVTLTADGSGFTSVPAVTFTGGGGRGQLPSPSSASTLATMPSRPVAPAIRRPRASSSRARPQVVQPRPALQTSIQLPARSRASPSPTPAPAIRRCRPSVSTTPAAAVRVPWLPTLRYRWKTSTSTMAARGTLRCRR